MATRMKTFSSFLAIFWLLLSVGSAFGLHIDHDAETNSFHLCLQECKIGPCEQEADTASCADETIFDHLTENGLLVKSSSRSKSIIVDSWAPAAILQESLELPLIIKSIVGLFSEPTSFIKLQATDYRSSRAPPQLI